jgi:hypothetical protein
MHGCDKMLNQQLIQRSARCPDMQGALLRARGQGKEFGGDRRWCSQSSGWEACRSNAQLKMAENQNTEHITEHVLQVKGVLAWDGVMGRDPFTLDPVDLAQTPLVLDVTATISRERCERTAKARGSFAKDFPPTPTPSMQLRLVRPQRHSAVVGRLLAWRGCGRGQLALGDAKRMSGLRRPQTRTTRVPRSCHRGLSHWRSEFGPQSPWE